ncbi:MAG: Hsp20/alpha crystallin family protein [Anaerolineales bacterium]|nr:Hsp20/alpha crystallin family protein [Anaerolineales bacterium]
MLARWDPFSELMNLRRTVDRLFDNTVGTQGEDWTQQVTWGLALDVMENKDDFVVKASIPGIDPEDIDVTYSDGTLSIKGETKAEREVNEANYHLRERHYGSFARSIRLPYQVKADAIEANYDKGVLTLRLPKVEEAKPKRIAIKATRPKVIEAKTK